MFENLLVIAIGGAFGAVFRQLTAQSIYQLTGQKFPYGILVVNVLGSFLIGLLAVIFMDRFVESATLRAALLVGFLGSFTTFSTFSIDTINLFEQGNIMLAVLYVLSSVILCLMATFIGLFIGRNI